MRLQRQCFTKKKKYKQILILLEQAVLSTTILKTNREKVQVYAE